MIRVIDLEVENKPWYGQLASLHNPENYIVEAGWLDLHSGQPPNWDAVQTHRSNSLKESEDTTWFNLDGVTILVAHNAAYELHCFLCRHRDEVEKFLKRGGRIFCTQWCEYLLSDFQHHYPSLNEIAPNYGGTQKVDGIKILWEQGVLTSAIDPVLLHDYLAGYEGDVVNTAKVFLGQYSKLVERGQEALFWERMRANTAFAYCEFFGLHVDTDVAYTNMAEREEELKALRSSMQQYLPADLPEHIEFSWSSRHDVSALLFGGARPYRELGEYDPPKFEKADFYKLPDGSLHPIEEGVPSECVTFASGKNKGMPKVFREDTLEPKLKWYEKLYTFQPLINLQGLPEVLRDKFDKDWQGAQTQRCGTPVYSTAAEVLEVLAVHGWPSAATLNKIHEVEKDLGSFYLTQKLNADGTVKSQSGMLQFVQPDGIVHHQLNTCATVTQRLSSSKPNMQQLPRADEDDDGEAKSKVKQAFTSRFGTQGVILQSDYSAVEVVMLAAMSGDHALLNHMQNGTDMHCLRLAGVLQEPYESVLEKCKNREHPQHATYSIMRTNIKPKAFAFQYGATARGIAYATGSTVEDAQAFITAESALFPDSVAFRDVIREAVERTGNEDSGLYREQAPDGRWLLYRRGYYAAPSASRYSFRQYMQWDASVRRESMQYRPTQMANYWCQGEAFLVMAVAAGRVLDWLLSKNFYDGKVAIINCVHDALYLDCHLSVAAEVAATVKLLMEGTPKYMDAVLGTALGHVPFPADCVWGYSMQDEHALKTLPEYNQC